MFIKNARKGANNWYLYLLLFIIVFLAYNLGSLPLVGVLFMAIQKNPDLGMDALNEFTANPDFTLFDIDPNLGFFLLLLTFVFSFLAILWLFPVLHKRKFKSLITWTDNIDWKRIFTGFGIWLTLGVLLEAIFYFMNKEHYTFQFSFSSFFPLLLMSLLILPIQTTTEELLFRGYLMQGIGNATNSKIIALIITSVMFGAIHSMNPEIEKFGFWTMQIYYVGAGLLLGIVTLMDDRMELAIGIHAATNFVGAVFVGYEGAAIQTESLFKTSYLNTTNMTIAFFVCAVIFYLIASKKYNWKSLRTLLDPVSTDKSLAIDE